MYTYRIGSRIW